MLEVIRSGQLSLGPMLPRFERDFAAKLGVEIPGVLVSIRMTAYVG